MIEDQQIQTDTHETDALDDNFANIKEFEMADAANRAQRIGDSMLIDPQDDLKTNEKRNFPVAKTILATAIGASLVTGIGILASENGGSNSPEQGKADKTIESVTLNAGANIRNDPFVGGSDVAPTEVLQLDAKVKIDANHDIRVLDGTSNGTWIGIPLAEIKEVIPNINSQGDKDGILWVNEQGVESVKHSTETSNQ